MEVRLPSLRILIGNPGSPVLIFVALLTDRNQPLDWLLADIAPRVLLMMHLGGTLAATDAGPVVSLQHDVPLSLPVI